MTDTDIVTRLAREAGLARPDDPRTGYARFAALIAEECAKVADATLEIVVKGDEGNIPIYGEHCADAIRARFVHSPKPLT